MSNKLKPDGTPGRTARRKQKATILYLAQLAILTAIIMVLHFSGAAIPAFGTKISLTLIPIALGSMILGPTAGGILGLIYGLTVYISLGVLHMDLFTGFLFDHNPIMTFLICTVKSTAAGVVGGLVYRALRKKSILPAVFATAALVPTVNTGIFVLGCFTVYGTINQYIQYILDADYSAVYFILILCAGANYLLEMAVNLILAPALERIINVTAKK